MHGIRESIALTQLPIARILFTPFRYQNVPPPMSSLTLQCSCAQTPLHISFAQDTDVLAALMPHNVFELWRWQAGRRERPVGTHLGTYSIENEGIDARQVSLVSSGDTTRVFLLAQDNRSSSDMVVEVYLQPSMPNSTLPIKERRNFTQPLTHLFAYKDTVAVQTGLGHVLSLNGASIAKLPEFCSTIQTLHDGLIIALSESGRLYLNNQLLASGCSSFATAGDFLIYTTLQHEARFVLLQALIQKSEDPEAPMTIGYSQALPADKQIDPNTKEPQGDVRTGYARRVERGSRIVTVVASSMSMILQMPRGNLETISPRPLVLQVVRHHLDEKRYREAFLVCRRHRIDLNILCDHDRSAFLRDLPQFVDQIDDTEYLNLFVTGLKYVWNFGFHVNRKLKSYT